MFTRTGANASFSKFIVCYEEKPFNSETLFIITLFWVMETDQEQIPC